MNDNDLMPEQQVESDSNEEGSMSNFMMKLFPVVFEKAILEAKSDEEREDLAIKFGNSPIIKYDTITNLFTYVGHVQFNEKREADAEVLIRFAKITSNVFISNKTQKIKNGISIQYSFEDKIIQSLGHSLNEGVTEWFTRKMMKEALTKGLFKGQEGITDKETEEYEQSKNGTYLIEVRLADKLINEFGEQLVGRAYFGGIEELTDLISEMDERLGKNAFIRLLQYSDSGSWREAFGIF